MNLGTRNVLLAGLVGVLCASAVLGLTLVSQGGQGSATNAGTAELVTQSPQSLNAASSVANSFGLASSSQSIADPSAILAVSVIGVIALVVALGTAFVISRRVA